jgi:hypothetical protein
MSSGALNGQRVAVKKTVLFVSRCGRCGTSHTADRWATLPLLGSQKIEADEEGPEQLLELRDCSCGSTLAIPRDPGQDIEAAGVPA